MSELWAQQGKYDKEIETSLFNSGFGDFLCNSFALIFCLVLLIFPLYSAIMIIVDHRHNKLPDEAIRRKYVVLVQDSRHNSLPAALLHVSYMIRRFLVVTILMTMQALPLIQLMLLLELSLFNLCYLSAVKPYILKRQNKIEIFNECILWCSYIICMIYEVVVVNKPYNTQDILAYIHIVLTGINIFICIVSMAVSFP